MVLNKKGRSVPLDPPTTEEEVAKRLRLEDDDVLLDKDFVHVQMMATIPSERFRFSEPAMEYRYWLWANSKQLHKAKLQVNFTRIAEHVRPALDASGVALPILISTIFDFSGLGQPEMWRIWFNRQSIYKHYLRDPNDLRSPQGFSGPFCSHFITKWQAKKATDKPYYQCLWCDHSDVLPPYHYALMQQLDIGVRHCTDKQHTAALARLYKIPNADVSDWQVIPMFPAGASTSKSSH
jgi:hypothetical protein